MTLYPKFELISVVGSLKLQFLLQPCPLRFCRAGHGSFALLILNLWLKSEKYPCRNIRRDLLGLQELPLKVSVICTIWSTQATWTTNQCLMLHFVGILRPILLQLRRLLQKQALVKLDLLFPVFCFQGNEFFKQKKFADAIECYSRSIGLSPTAVTFANRAMAYLKLRRQVTLRLYLYAFTSPLLFLHSAFTGSTPSPLNLKPYFGRHQQFTTAE